jgi:hypothetical protein
MLSIAFAVIIGAALLWIFFFFKWPKQATANTSPIQLPNKSPNNETKPIESSSSNDQPSSTTYKMDKLEENTSDTANTAAASICVDTFDQQQECKERARSRSRAGSILSEDFFKISFQKLSNHVELSDRELLKLAKMPIPQAISAYESSSATEESFLKNFYTNKLLSAFNSLISNSKGDTDTSNALELLSKPHTDVIHSTNDMRVVEGGEGIAAVTLAALLEWSEMQQVIDSDRLTKQQIIDEALQITRNSRSTNGTTGPTRTMADCADMSLTFPQFCELMVQLESISDRGEMRHVHAPVRAAPYGANLDHTNDDNVESVCPDKRGGGGGGGQSNVVGHKGRGARVVPRRKKKMNAITAASSAAGGDGGGGSAVSFRNEMEAHTGTYVDLDEDDVDHNVYISSDSDSDSRSGSGSDCDSDMEYSTDCSRDSYSYSSSGTRDGPEISSFPPEICEAFESISKSRITNAAATATTAAAATATTAAATFNDDDAADDDADAASTAACIGANVVSGRASVSGSDGCVGGVDVESLLQWGPLMEAMACQFISRDQIVQQYAAAAAAAAWMGSDDSSGRDQCLLDMDSFFLLAIRLQRIIDENITSSSPHTLHLHDGVDDGADEGDGNNADGNDGVVISESLIVDSGECDNGSGSSVDGRRRSVSATSSSYAIRGRRRRGNISGGRNVDMPATTRERGWSLIG